jgi:hypothetical protein
LATVAQRFLPAGDVFVRVGLAPVGQQFGQAAHPAMRLFGCVWRRVVSVALK